MSQFFAMNGYGFYIWSAYGAAVLAVAAELLALRARRRTALAEAHLTMPDDAGSTTEATG